VNPQRKKIQIKRGRRDERVFVAGQEKYLWEDRRGGRILREEDTVCCATITMFTLVRQLRQLCKKQQNLIVKQKLAIIVFWTKGAGGDLIRFTKISSEPTS
jgi:hypothetical protein